jgi:hypothetical protein
MENATMTKMKKIEIVPARLAVQAMRSNGYKNAAYALAELMDNSIQAHAKHVELLCVQSEEFVGQRTRQRIDRIAVLDDGDGMDAGVLSMALQFGNGTNLAQASQKDMGKFGMGLPASSISQASRVDVWSWKNGHETALYTYLDVQDIISGRLDYVPEPVKKKVPDEWLRYGKSYGKTGTLVVWSKIDRCIWRTGRAIIANSEHIVGRMYRKFLVSKKVEIRLACIDSGSGECIIDNLARPNDPMYLMKETSTPPPYNDMPMFEPFPKADNFETKVEILVGGQKHYVKVRASMAKKEARQGTAGNRKYGEHAAKNVGVSVLRSGRELELDPAWAASNDTRERWWGIEVEFEPALDDIFGVTNNKQHARNFNELATFDLAEIVAEGRTRAAYKDELLEDGDPHGYLLDVSDTVRSLIKQMREIIDVQKVNARSQIARHSNGALGAEKEATEKTRQQQKEGEHGFSDDDENKSQEERKVKIVGVLTQNGLNNDEANELAAATVDSRLKYVFAEANLDSPAFFSVQPSGGTLILTLNTLHPAYPRLVDVLERNHLDQTPAMLKERLDNALDGLKLLLMAWARYEDIQDSTILRERTQDARIDWGRMARRFMDPKD